MADKSAESYRQRLVGEVGRTLEANVRYIINEVLNKRDVWALTVSDIMRWAKDDGSHRKLAEYIKVPVKNSCTQQQIMTLPDTDILTAYKQEDKVSKSVVWHPLCIVSCKASFHGRETESLFWSAMTRDSKIRFVLVTEDADRYGAKPKTELKTCETANKPRRLLECFLDRTYIIKKYSKVRNGIVKDINKFYPVFEKAEAQNYRGVNSQIFDDYERKPHAEYCNLVRPFDDLLIDLMHWKFEKLK